MSKMDLQTQIDALELLLKLNTQLDKGNFWILFVVLATMGGVAFVLLRWHMSKLQERISRLEEVTRQTLPSAARPTTELPAR